MARTYLRKKILEDVMSNILWSFFRHRHNSCICVQLASEIKVIWQFVGYFNYWISLD